MFTTDKQNSPNILNHDKAHKYQNKQGYLRPIVYIFFHLEERNALCSSEICIIMYSTLGINR